MMMRIVVTCVVASCGQHDSAGPPAPAPAPAHSYPPPPSGPDLDLDKTRSASVELVLEGKPVRRIVAVPPEARIDIAVANLGGTAAEIEFDVFEPGVPVAVSGSRMKCAEADCSLSSTIAVGPGIRWLTIEVAANAPLKVRLTTVRR